MGEEWRRTVRFQDDVYDDLIIVTIVPLEDKVEEATVNEKRARCMGGSKRKRAPVTHEE